MGYKSKGAACRSVKHTLLQLRSAAGDLGLEDLVPE